MEIKTPMTLAEFNALPLRRAYPVSVIASQLGERLVTVDKTNTDLDPCVEAINFYGLNQLLAKVQQMFTPNTPLPDWAAEIVLAYRDELLKQHQSLVWYVFLIITREFRHLKSKETFFAKHPLKFPESIRDMHLHVADNSSQSQCNKWLEKVPQDMSLDQYCESIAFAFEKGSWPGSYGGPPWANIARTLGKYISGSCSAEVFVDTAYTLAHNTAPIFNKDMLYTTPSALILQRILDVQRSGQICEAVTEGSVPYTPPKLKSLIIKSSPYVQGIGKYVDWYKVEEWAQDGHKYTSDKIAQDKKYGKPVQTKLVDGKPVKVIGTYEAAPGVHLDIYQRLKAA